MELLLSIIIALCAVTCTNFIRNNAVILYVVALLFSATSILYPTPILTPIVNGSFGFAYLFVVMYIGILPKNTKVFKQLRNVRSELAIIGCILLSSHIYQILEDSIISKLPLEIFGILALLFLLPLFTTSFKVVRNKLATSTWIRIHRYSYLAYFFIYLHLISNSSIYHAFVYTILFGTYSIIKIQSFLQKRSLLKATLITIIIGSTSLFFLSTIPSSLENQYNIIEGNTFRDGTYIGYAKGYHKIDATVQVVIKNNIIQTVIIEECGCTPYFLDGKYYDAAYEVAREIRNDNSTLIDSISGATTTSDAITKAVRDALEHALVK